MCGIAGVVRFDPRATVDPAVLEGMAAALAHRGPDDEGFHFEGGVGLAHRRLAIIDLAGGRQPIYNEDRSVVVVLNGEIYNYRELSARLEARGHRFATRSDTETVVHSFEDRGEDCVADLRGMFAFAAWDRRRRRLMLARDRLGIKPLYYHVGRDFLAFASEIKALLVHPGVPREIDPDALDLYLSLRYVPGPRTMFRGIAKLQPGHLLTWDERGPRLRRYWDVPRAEPASADPAELRRRWLETLEECVRMHMVAEVPVGVLLSGGLDSTSVLALGSRLGGGTPMKTYSVGYRWGSRDAVDANEFEYARLAAESFGAEHREVALGDEEFREALPRLVWHLDEPVADPACVPLYFVSRRAREEVTVVLSGEGADEILAGYGVYPRMLALERLHALAGGGGTRRARALRALGRGLPGERPRHLLELALRPLERRYRGVSRAFRPELKARLLGRGGGDELLDAVFARHYRTVEGAPALDRMLYVDVKTWLPDDLLIKADRMTMANSQELRVPFLDHVLVELAASLPAAAKLRGTTGKAILRETMDGKVPHAIVERRKKGFPVPTVSLLRRLGEFSRGLLLDSDSASRSHFDRATLATLLDQHERGQVRRDQEIWSLLVFELWHRVFLDRRLEPAQARPRPSRQRPAVAAAGG
jgi:asparagine synthase (glutamine-hydrolysing)